MLRSATLWQRLKRQLLLFFHTKDPEGFSFAWYIWQRCVNQQEWWYAGLLYRRVSLHNRANKYFQYKQSPTRGDKKSATVFLSEATARKYNKSWFVVSAEIKEMRWSLLWICTEICAGLTATAKEEFLCLFLKSNFALSYGFFIFNLHCILLVEFHISTHLTL